MKDKTLGYLNRAYRIAAKSKDPSTKVGAYFMDADEISPVGFGYNGMPRGLPDNDIAKNTRPEKYLWYEHAERNALYNKAQDMMEKGMIFCTNFPNMEAARAIVSVGLSLVIVPSIDRTREHFEKVLELFALTRTTLLALDDNQLSERLLNKYASYMDLAQGDAEDFADDLCATKSAALILNKNTFAPVSSGVSGPPPSLVIDEAKLKIEGESFWIQEAEKNAIFNAIRPIFKGSKGYVSWCPCAHCALALASVGTAKVVTEKPDFTKEAEQRWQSHFIRTEEVFKQTNIELELVDTKGHKISQF